MGWRTKKYERTYYLFLITILITLILKEVVIQYNINQQKADAKIINLSGRQRMLSQRVSTLVLFIHSGNSTNSSNVDSLNKLVNEWEQSYRYVYHFSKTHANNEILTLHKSNLIHHNAIIKSVKKYLDNQNEQNLANTFEVIKENELKFLFSMENIVAEYQKNAEAKLERLKSLELYLFIFTVVLFLAELTLIVYPVVEEIVLKNASLKNLNITLIANELEIKKSNLALIKLKNEIDAKDAHNRIFIQQAPNAIAMFDTQLNYITVSEKWKRDYHLIGKNIIGMNHYEVFPEIKQDWKEIYQNCLKGANHQCDEAELVRTNGRIQWISWDIRPWYKADQKIGGILMYTDDITISKEKDAQKNRLKEILSITSEIATIGTWEVDLLNNKIYWSKITREIHEVDENYEPVLESAINFYVEGENRSNMQNAVTNAIEKGLGFDVEVQLKTFKGNLIWIRSIGQVKFLDGKCVGLYGIFQDINKIKTTEIALNIANNELKAIFDSSPIAIIGTSPAGLITHFNKGAEKMLQYSASEVLFKFTPSVIHKQSEIFERQKELSAFYKKEISDFDVFVEAAKNDLVEARQWTYIKKDGTEFPIELVITAIKDAENKVTGFLSLGIDISERLESEHKILQAKENLEILTKKLTHQNKQLASFAHITSHNLRSPVSNLNALLSFYKIGESAEEKEILIEKFEIVINHLTNTLDTLVDAIKIKENRDTEMVRINFKDVYDKTVEILIGQIMQTQAEITFDFSKAPELVYNQTYLESIFLNLLTNSLKYKSKDKTPEIFIETFMVNNNPVLRVTDNGLGLDLSKHGDKLFGLNKTFHRHAEAKGVGLYLTKTQVEAMGGSIYAQSEVNKGSTFIVEF